MNTSKQLWFAITLVSLLWVIGGYCTAQSTIKPAPTQVEGLYTYEHAFEYDLDDNHFDVHETGTMDFHPDGTALDSARQVYAVTLKDGGKVTYVFNYVSPSKWRLEGDDFYFAGIKDRFRMKVIEGGDNEPELAQKIVDVVGGSIDYEYKFHLDTLTTDLLQWSFTYRDGHSDTWKFYRVF